MLHDVTEILLRKFNSLRSFEPSSGSQDLVERQGLFLFSKAPMGSKTGHQLNTHRLQRKLTVNLALGVGYEHNVPLYNEGEKDLLACQYTAWRYTRVTGSSPVRGAKNPRSSKRGFFICP